MNISAVKVPIVTRQYPLAEESDKGKRTVHAGINNAGSDIREYQNACKCWPFSLATRSTADVTRSLAAPRQICTMYGSHGWRRSDRRMTRWSVTSDAKYARCKDALGDSLRLADASN